MNFMGMGPGEMVLILIIALIVLGPGKLPEMMRTVGKTVREIKMISEGFQRELNREINSATEEPKRPAATTTAAPAPVVQPANDQNMAAVEAAAVAESAPAPSDPAPEPFVPAGAPETAPVDQAAPAEEHP